MLKGMTLVLPVCRDQRPTVRPRPGLREHPLSIPIITVYIMDVVGAIAVLYMAFSNYQFPALLLIYFNSLFSV